MLIETSKLSEVLFFIINTGMSSVSLLGTLYVVLINVRNYNLQINDSHYICRLGIFVNITAQNVTCPTKVCVPLRRAFLLPLEY